MLLFWGDGAFLECQTYFAGVVPYPHRTKLYENLYKTE